jgi:hypothetical protein
MQGKFVINPQFDAAMDFSNGLARVGLGGGISGNFIGRKVGYVDAAGKYVWNPNK